MAALRGGNRLDRLVLLFHLARQSPRSHPPIRHWLGRGVAGELWSVHGGGFYNAHKYRVAPETLPPSLHWFYWEAYTTFLSGFFLLCLLYYGQARGVSDRPISVRAVETRGHCHRHRISHRRLVHLRRPVPLAARPKRAGRSQLCSPCCCQRPRGLCAICSADAAPTWSSARCSARSWWRTCSSSSFLGSASSCEPNRKDREPDPTARHRRQAALHAQHLFHAAGVVRDDQPSLCDDLRCARELAGADRDLRCRGV